MSKTLLLFMFSPNVDTYVNSISHAFDKLRVEKVRLIHVKNATTGLDTDQQASTISTRIWQQIEYLADGKYVKYPKYFRFQGDNTSDSNQLKTVGVEDGNLDIYRRIHSRLLDRHLLTVDYHNLKQEVAYIIKQNGGQSECILDATAATKVPSIDLFAIALALGVKNLYVFELDDPPNRELPYQSLYHSITTPKKYNYTSLLSTKPVQDSYKSLIRVYPVMWIVSAIFGTVLIFSLASLVLLGSDSLLVIVISLISSIFSLITSIMASLKSN